MRLRIELDNTLRERINELSNETLPQRRQELIQQAMREGLAHIIETNPVDTARSRAAWVRSLEQLGATPPPGWQGPHPSEIEAGRKRGRLQTAQSDSTSECIATNSVEYIPFLEYGTSKMAPFAMVRRALTTIERRLPEWFRLS